MPAQRSLEAKDNAVVAHGRIAITNEVMNCTECHQFRRQDENAIAPDLTGYGSRDWLIAMITDPKHPRFYGRRNDRMPAFVEQNILTKEQVALLADWLRGDFEITVAEK